MNAARVIDGLHAPATESHPLHRNGEGRLTPPSFLVSPPVLATVISLVAHPTVPAVVLPPPPVRAWRPAPPALDFVVVRRATNEARSMHELSLDLPRVWLAPLATVAAAAVAAAVATDAFAAIAATTVVAATTSAAAAAAADEDDFCAFAAFRSGVLRQEQVLSTIIDGERFTVRSADRIRGSGKVGETS